MIDYLKDNWRDLLAAVGLLLLFAFTADLLAKFAAWSGLDLLHLVNALGGLSKLMLVVASVWFVNAITLPGSFHKFIVHSWDEAFDKFSLREKFVIVVIFICVLLGVATVCFQ